MIPGETGIVTPCENPDLVADAVTRLLLAPQELQKMGEAARSWAVNNFDWTSLTKKFVQLFDVVTPAQAEDHTTETAARSAEATTGASA